MKDIVFYTMVNGKCPFIDWLNDMSIDYRVRINKRINRMREGNYGDWKRVQNSKLCEMRLDFGKGYRIYYKELDNVIVLIVAGSDKSNQNTVIKQANIYLEDYMNREYYNDNKI